MEGEKKQDSKEEEPPLETIRVPQFLQGYANNVRFEASVWDLRIIFGILDQAENSVKLHTALNIPWMQVKLMAYYLRAQIDFHEQANGRINVPRRIAPVSVASAIPGLANEAGGKEVLERLEKLRIELFEP